MSCHPTTFGESGNRIAHGKRFPLLGMLSLIVLLLACGSGEEGSDSGADSTGTGTQADSSVSKKTKEKSIKVNVAAVQRGELVIPVFADGVIRTPRSVEVRTKVGGELVKVLVRDGDYVRSGELLAQIDAREYALALEESRYRHFQALSQAAAEEESVTVNNEALSEFTDQRADLERMRRRGKLSRDEFRARLLKLEMSALQRGAFRQEMFEERTGLGEARTAEERAKLNFEHTEIRAPFAGRVEGLSVVRGEIVGTGASVCTVVNNERLEASVNVLEADLGNLVEGRPVLVAIPATGDTVQAEVDVISPLLDQASRTCQILIRFDNPEGHLRPGMFARAEIAGWIYPDRLMAPKAAVLTRDNRPLVFKVNEDRVQWLYVETGLGNDRWIEILKVFSGGSLSPGDRVVVSDHLTLAHEAKIKIRQTKTPTNRWAFATPPAE